MTKEQPEALRESPSLRQRADAWMAVCALLHELRPGWCEGPESMQEQALKAIRALAQEAEWCAPDGGVFGYFRPTMDGWEDCSEGDVGAVALYEHQHLQPLTDKQIQDVWCSAKNEGNQHGPFWFARAIERAHGIT